MSESEFERQASAERPGYHIELWAFVRRRWWLAPIVLVLLVLGGLMILGSTSAGPFIYTIF